jgi:MFS family permease
LKATVADVQWVVEAYSLFLAALILVGGSLGDYFGRRRIFAIGVSLFAVASVLCGLAPTIVLLIARALQGIGVSHPLVLTALAIGVVALLMFLLVEACSRVPVLPLSLFRSPTFSGANVLTLLLYAALGGALFFVPFNLIRAQGYSPAAVV